MAGLAARIGWVAVALCLSLFMAGPALAEPVGPSGFTRAEIADFAREVQDALAQRDTRRLARLSQWPLRVNVAPGKVRLVAALKVKRQAARAACHLLPVGEAQASITCATSNSAPKPSTKPTIGSTKRTQWLKRMPSICVVASTRPVGARYSIAYCPQLYAETTM